METDPKISQNIPSQSGRSCCQIEIRTMDKSFERGRHTFFKTISKTAIFNRTVSVFPDIIEVLDTGLVIFRETSSPEQRHKSK